jgi:TPR repeat protein
LKARHLLLGCLLATFAGNVLAAEPDIDAALARVGPLEESSDFAGIADLLRPYAASGNAEVEYYLGFAYMNQAIIGRRPEDVQPIAIQPAIDFAQRAARHGSKEAWNLLYLIYGQGLGVPVAAADAVGYLKRGIAAGDQAAKMNYAIQLYEGSPLVERDLDVACVLFDELVADKAMLEVVSYYAGVILFRGQCGKTADKAAGIDLIRMAADHGMRSAERDMGKNSEFGWVGPVDEAQVLAWYGKAAGHGDPEAQWRVGMIYVNGEFGQRQDFAKAREHFEGSAASNYPNALTDLGSMYAAGEGVDRDFAKAKELYEQAAGAGAPRALRELAVMYAQGEGVAVDLVKARVLYLEALRKGLAEDEPLKRLLEAKMSPEQVRESDQQSQQAP